MQVDIFGRDTETRESFEDKLDKTLGDPHAWSSEEQIWFARREAGDLIDDWVDQMKDRFKEKTRNPTAFAARLAKDRHFAQGFYLLLGWMLGLWHASVPFATACRAFGYDARMLSETVEAECFPEEAAYLRRMMISDDVLH